MTPIDFAFKGSKVKVTLTFIKKRFPFNNLITHWPSNFLGALVLASRLPLFILDQWVKGQNGNLVGKNGF
jgi:hypothetical protein